MGPESLHVERSHGVEMIVAIDSTARGPALGGCRWRSYPSFESARDDALALARAMTRKATMARLDLGGGKAVVSGDPERRSPALLEAFGAFVDSLGGRYITAADMGTGQDAMAVIRRRTPHVIGLPVALGGCGDPAPYTAEGVQIAIVTSLSERGLELENASVAIQGVGAVGADLAARLVAGGAEVLAADTDPAALDSLSKEVRRVEPADLLELRCDVLAPCGPPGVITGELVPRLRCDVVCGAANNPLGGPDVAEALHARGILYAPDFVANAGGLIHLAVARGGGDAQASRARLRVIAENLTELYGLSRSEGSDPLTIAERVVAASMR